MKNGNMSVTRLSVKNGNLSVRKRFSPDKLYFKLTLSVRRRGPTDKICPIGKLLSGLTLSEKRRNFKRSLRRKKNINWPSVRLSGSFALEILRGL